MTNELLSNRVDGLVTFTANLSTPGGLTLNAIAFQTITGGGITISNTVKDRGVGEKYSHDIPNLPDVEDFTAARTWIEARDQALYDFLVAYVGLTYADVTRNRRDLNGNRAGYITHKDCLFKGISAPDGDTSSQGDKSMLSLTFGGGIPG